MQRFEFAYIRTRPARTCPGQEDSSHPIHEAQTHEIIAKDEYTARQKMSEFINEPQPPGHSRSWDGNMRLIRDIPARPRIAFADEDARS